MSENKRERRLKRQKNLGSLKLQTLNTPFLFLETQTQTNIYIYIYACLFCFLSFNFGGGVWREDHLSPAKSDGGGGSMSSRK